MVTLMLFSKTGFPFYTCVRIRQGALLSHTWFWFLVSYFQNFSLYTIAVVLDCEHLFMPVNAYQHLVPIIRMLSAWTISCSSGMARCFHGKTEETLHEALVSILQCRWDAVLSIWGCSWGRSLQGVWQLTYSR